MKSKIIAGIIVLFLLATAVAAADIFHTVVPFAYSSIYSDIYRTGPHRVTDYDVRVPDDYKVDSYVYLAPLEERKWTRGYPPFAPRGTAEILSVRNRYTPRSQVTVSVKDLEPSYKEGGVYEAWLYDADYGYRLSIGVFKAAMGGVGVLTYRGHNYLDQYDYVVITKEPYPDPDPLPGDVILMGEITKPRDYFRPWSAQQELYGYED